MSPVQTAPSSENLLLGKGQMFFERFDANGAGMGMRHMGNVETLEITTADDNVDKNSSMTAGGPLYKRVNRRRTVTLRAVADEFTAENLAMMMMGETATLAQAATAVVGEAVAPVTNAGTYFKTKLLGPVTGVAVHFGATLGVLGTDFAVVNPDVGLIRILPDTILTGAVTVDYTPTAYTSPDGPQVIKGGTAGTVEGSVLFVGDPASGPAMQLEVWHVSVSPDGAVGLISDDYAQMTLSMAIMEEALTHPDNPLYQLTYLP